MAELTMNPNTQAMGVRDDSPTVSVHWDKVVQAAITTEKVGPTISSRAYAMMHTAIYDAWAASDDVADGVHYDGAIDRGDDAIADAMSHAAHGVLVAMFPERATEFDAKLRELGLEPDADTPEAELGREAAEAILLARVGDGTTANSGDGANQLNGYAAPVGTDGDPIYSVINNGPGQVTDIERWTPENVPIDPEDADPEQTFLTPHWGEVTPFGLVSGDVHRPEAPEPFFLVEGATLDIYEGTITLADGSVVPVSKELIGTIINPAFVAQAQRVVDASADLTAEHKLIAEFWEDGDDTSFPPGNAMTLAQFVSARDDHTEAQDARMFLAVANGQMDAGIASWESKTHYDYARPVRVIRELGRLGLIGEDGVDEMTGERGHVIRAWGGPGEGTRTILAENWLPYQPPGGNPSPPFAEYVSGHSTFSAAGAEILRMFARSDKFGGSLTFPSGSSRFEPGTTPGESVILSWDTFTEAADQSGLSRIYGGIHFDDGDLNGRALGRDVARDAFAAAMGYIQGIGDGRADDVIVRSGSDDMIAGLKGDDRITTGKGSDGIVHMAGDGDDVIADFDVNGGRRQQNGGERDFDTLILSGHGVLDGEYATYAELRQLVRAIENDGDGRTDAIIKGRDLVLAFGAGGSVTLEGVVRTLGGKRSLMTLGADNGRVAGTNGHDRLRATAGDARYDGGRGDDVIRTGGGRDTIAFRSGDGHDTVRDFDVDGGHERSFDTLRLSGFGRFDGSYSTTGEILWLIDALNGDDDRETEAKLGRRHLELTFADGSAITLRNVTKDLHRRA